MLQYTSRYYYSEKETVINNPKLFKKVRDTSSDVKQTHLINKECDTFTVYKEKIIGATPLVLHNTSS